MRNDTLSQQYAVIGLDGMEALHPSIAKNSVIRGIAAAKLLERYVFSGSKQELSNLKNELEEGIRKIKGMDRKQARSLEQEMVKLLMKEGLLEIVPDLLSCDMNYTTAGIELRAYRGQEEAYQRTVQGVRAEILEEGPVTLDCICLLWLFRESGCLHDLFSLEEQDRIEARMVDIKSQDSLAQMIWEAEYHGSLERMSAGFRHLKKNLFKNPYLEGVNVLFPFLDRRKAVFIDFVVLGTNVAGRRLEVMAYLTEHGHYVQEVKNGTETLLKIDNCYYRIFPTTKTCSRIPIQGVSLVPVYK